MGFSTYHVLPLSGVSLNGKLLQHRLHWRHSRFQLGGNHLRHLRRHISHDLSETPSWLAGSRPDRWSHWGSSARLASHSHSHCNPHSPRRQSQPCKGWQQRRRSCHRPYSHPCNRSHPCSHHTQPDSRNHSNNHKRTAAALGSHTPRQGHLGP